VLRGRGRRSGAALPAALKDFGGGPLGREVNFAVLGSGDGAAALQAYAPRTTKKRN